MLDGEAAVAAFAAEVFQEAASVVEDSPAPDFAAASQASASRVIVGPGEHAGLVEVSVRDGVAAGVATDPVGAIGQAGVGRQLELGAAAITAGAYYGSNYPYFGYGYGYGGYAGYGYDDCASVPLRIFDGYGYRVVWTSSCEY